MDQGKQNFFDAILDKHVGSAGTIILSAILGFGIYYFFGDYTDLEKNGKYAIIVAGYPLLFIIRKVYWSLRIKSFLFKNIYALKNNKTEFLNYYRTHAWRNVHYYFGFYGLERELDKYDLLGKIKYPDGGWYCHRCGEYNSIEVTRCNKCTQRKNKPVEF